MSPEERAVAWRTADARRGEEREALLHLLAEQMLVELRSDLDLYGAYEDLFVESLDLLDRQGRFFDHAMLMAYQALGVEDEGHEASRRLLATLASRLAVTADDGGVAPAARARAGELADLWREHLSGGEQAQYLSVAQVAARYGVTPQAVYRWIHSGKIESDERPGGSYRIPLGQFLAPPALRKQRAETRRKLRELQRQTPMSEDEIVAALREGRRADDAAR